MSKKIYFLADIHLTYLLYKNRPDISRDTYRALNSTVDYIINDDVSEKAVVMCGDNFDTKYPAPSDTLALQEAVDRLAAVGIAVYGIEGNHDRFVTRVLDDGTTEEVDATVAYAEATWLSTCRGVTILDPVGVVDVLGVSVFGFDYVQGSSLYDKLDTVPECDILVLHQPLDHLSPFESNTLTLDSFPETVSKAVLLGHVHHNDISKTADGVFVVSPGSLHAQKLTHPKGSFIAYDVEANTFDTVYTPVHRIMSRYLLRSDSNIDSVDTDIQNILDALVTEGRVADYDKPIIGVKYTEEAKQGVEMLNQKYKDKVHMFLTADTEGLHNTEEEVSSVILSPKEIVEQVMEENGIVNTTDLMDLSLAIIDGDIEHVIDELEKRERAINENKED